ncbi:uncharacterized protein CANTADRAFT_299083 [Suhomyces tanzawaensis NRRL Y-17324]|uniref:Uncharacterized protein n=1 Tax=Suhomyces tanzawaensis NRRL Y-17324 TaxID=984487 RepID=A0A1E4SFF8_9ASCO|nr:uncharacterized protein CANTADRAFT_299083 [Suhomyces tanzawaensis NRRL Y-17324]ODV78200.1 hypothetical protein CANTADRAFT_299083 [Suhomyces tanzawaensis NRRL Y-17324]
MSQLDQLRHIIAADSKERVVTEDEYDYDDDDYDYDDDDYDDDYESDSDDSFHLTAQEQWEESMKQIEGLISFVIFPLVGKVLGRRTSHIIWRRIANWWFI